jgi:hypothetical protein
MRRPTAISSARRLSGAPRRERLLHQVTQPGVIRRVGVEHVRVDARRLARPGPAAARPPVDVLRQPGVGQDRPHVRLPGDGPCPPVARHPHRSDRPGLTQLREEPRRVLIVGVFVEGSSRVASVTSHTLVCRLRDHHRIFAGSAGRPAALSGERRRA